MVDIQGPERSGSLRLVHGRTILTHGIYVMNPIVIPIGVEQLVLRHEDAVEAFTVNKYLFDVLPLDLVVIDGVRMLAIINIYFNNGLVLVGYGPELAILEVSMLEISVRQNVGRGQHLKLEGILQRHLILLEAKHRVQVIAAQAGTLF